MKKISTTSRIILAFASLSLIAVYFLPVWRIDLSAPQYPEGLSMSIWLNKLSGQVEIINGLNHYIGMKHIKAEMFPEFSYLVYVLGAFILFGLITALTGNRKVLLSFILTTIVAGIAAMVDFYKWGYDYGHNLDPTAAIQIPGFSYQPPLIGHKQLLNFDAYSFPDTGGWLVIAIAGIFISVWFFDYLKRRKNNTAAPKKGGISSLPKASVSIAVAVLIFFSSCTVKPQPFAFGKDACSYCKMTIIAPNFGGEVLTKKGKVYKFDDVHCLIGFFNEGIVKENDIAQTLAVNYQKQNDFINVNDAVFLVSPELHSPMNGNAAAFINTDEANKVKEAKGGELKDWQGIRSSIH